MIKTNLNINGVDYFDALSITIDKSSSDYNKTSSFSAKFDNPFGRHNDTFNLNEEVMIYADITEGTPTTNIFGGIIENIDFSGNGTKGTVILTGRDFGAILQDIIAEPRIFKDTEVSEIVKSLLRQNVPNFTFNNVQVTSTTIERITFNGLSVFDCLKKLADNSSSIFYVDENKDLHFMEKANNPSGLTFNNTNVLNATFKKSDDDIFNLVKVVGDRQLTGARQDLITGTDNTGSVYQLDSKPFNTRVTVSGATNTFLQPGGILNINRPETENVKFLVDFNDSRVILTSGTAAGDNTVSNGTVVIFEYDQSTPLIRFAQDSTSQNQYGLKEKEIIDKNIRDALEAQVVADSFVLEQRHLLLSYFLSCHNLK